MLVLLTMVDYTSFAQLTVVNSRTRTTTKPQGEDAIVRFFGNGGDMFVYNWDYQQKTNVFTCRQSPTYPNANRYEFPIMVNYYGQIIYTVEDIVVVDKMCFFCGTEKTPSIEYDINGLSYLVYKKRGYIGRMRLDRMTDAVNGEVKYQICIINNTKELKRIDAIVSPVDPTDTLFGLVGTSCDDKSCYLLAKSRALGNFQCEMFEVTNSEEEFTDMVFCAPNFAIASRFPGLHYVFGMRGGNIVDNYYTHIHTNDLYYINAFSTSNTIDYYTNTNTTWHYDNVDIRLCRQKEYWVYMAYESFEGVPSNFPASQTTLFLMEVHATSDIQTIALQNVDSGVRDTGSFTDMVYLPSVDKVALVHKNTRTYSPWKSVVQIPYLFGTPVGTVNTYAATDDETLTSLDTYNGVQVWAAGTRPSHNDSVVLFYQNATYLNTSCYSQPNYHTAELKSIEKAVRTYASLRLVYPLEIEPLSWKTVAAQRVDINQRCFTMEPARADSSVDDDDSETEQ